MSKLNVFSLMIVLLVFLAMLLNGCATVVRNPNAGDEKAVAGGGKSVVLLRLSAEIDSKKLQGPERFYSLMASIDADQSPTGIFPYHSPSHQAQKNGWVYFILQPGTYYLGVSPKREAISSKDDRYLSAPEVFWFHVPRGNHVLYIGTLAASCRTTWGIFGRLVNECSGIRVIDESESAQAIAQDSFSQYGSPSLAHMKPMGKPINTRCIKELVPMGFMTTSTKNLMSPHWKKRAISRATGIESGEDVANGLSTLSAGREAGAGILLLYLTYLPVGITGGTIAGEIAEHKWQPTIQGLQQELKENDPAAMLGSGFESMLSKYCISKPIDLNTENDPFAQANQQGLKSIVQTEILNIELSECKERGSFCVAVTLRIRLWETAPKALVYDVVSYYANPKNRKEPLFYEAKVGEGSTSRTMEEYQGVNGRKLFKAEISKAIQASMQRFFNEVVKEKAPWSENRKVLLETK
ncbi:MAG: hypothetical protein OS130_04775 [Thermodesulfobacteriota bacterium]|nr:MAG: hypothetical protein OS130_04775 [Thermodesulfobacteriota bacterium]